MVPAVRPRVFDAFPFGGSPTEMLLLECRFTELYDAVDAFILVEADSDHQGHPKPWNYAEHKDQFAQWADKITYVQATELPSAEEFPPESNVWVREHAQREWIIRGLADLDASPDDIVLQSDADEIPRSICARNVRPQGDGFISFHQTAHFWAIDWLYTQGWSGTVAGRVEAALKVGFGGMRDMRNRNPHKLDNAGWHFSWLGGPEAWDYKVETFCHPETVHKIAGENGLRRFKRGIHTDDHKMRPCEVDSSYPKWMQDPANVPDSWRRPR